jgi:hypothetical protein
MCSSLSWLINKSKFAKRFERVLNEEDGESLSSINKLKLTERFIPMVNTMIIESIRSSIFYILLQTTTTVGSIFVPALLSAEEKNIFYNATEKQEVEYAHNLYWTIWGISLAVTLSNAINQLSNMDRKYIMRKINVSQMKKEGWSFLQKSGSIYNKYRNKKHDDFINVFWDRVEKLRFKQVITDLSYDNIDEDTDESNISNGSSYV